MVSLDLALEVRIDDGRERQLHFLRGEAGPAAARPALQVGVIAVAVGDAAPLIAGVGVEDGADVRVQRLEAARLRAAGGRRFARRLGGRLRRGLGLAVGGVFLQRLFQLFLQGGVVRRAAVGG